MPGFGDSIYEHPSFTFENPSRKEQATICAVVSAAIAVASTVAAISLNAVPNPFASFAASTMILCA